MKGELYEYYGEQLTQAAIAKKEGINRSTLADWYKKTGDMTKAVEGAKKSLAQRNIPYNNQVLSLKAIADKEELKFESLKRYYEQTNDIYKAVKLATDAKAKRNGNIEYNGKMLTILAIANLENLVNSSLARYYEQTNDIYKAVELAKIAQEKHNGTIPYNGTLMTISGIANLEEVKHDTLKEFYDIYDDIDKAVFITKQSQLKRQKALQKGKEKQYSELAKSFGMSTIKLNKLLNSGKTVDEIEKAESVKHSRVKSSEYLTYNGESLYKYCLEHSYNYWVISYLINTFGKSPEEAIKSYLENGQQIPTKWIYEKYGVLFKHLALSFGLDSNRIIKIMREENYSIEDAITRLIFISNNQDNDFRLIEIDWMHEVYQFLNECNNEEKEQAINDFYISQRELDFLNAKDKIINKIKRQLLLFEFSEIIEKWNTEELNEMFGLYDITDDEIKLIVTDLYNPFDKSIINPTSDFIKRKEYINSLILVDNDDFVSSLPNITADEVLFINRKKNILKQIMSVRNNPPGVNNYK